MNKINAYSIFDFETGGLTSIKNPMTELGAIGIAGDTLEEIDRYALLAKPYYDAALIYEPQALQVTGISIDLLLAEGVDIKLIVDRAIEHFEKLNPSKSFKYKPFIVGHNVIFDIGFLKAIFEFCKKDLTKYISGDKDRNGTFIPHYIDTLQLAKMTFGHDESMPNYKLGTVVEKFGLSQTEAHRSMSDIVPTKDILIQCIKKLRSSGQSMEEVNKQYSFRTHFQF
jgi:DNA polymerase III alpha subunit (gram-positive type)